MRRFFCLWMVGCLVLAGCSREVSAPSGPGEPVPGFRLQTEIGPVDVLSLIDSSDGVRTLKVHAIRDDGRHDVRWIEIRGSEVEDRPGFFEFSYCIRDEMGETYRLTQLGDGGADDYLEMTHETAGERLSVWVKQAGGRTGISVKRMAGGAAERVFREVDATRLDDLAYVASIRRSLDAVYTGSPFDGNREGSLLMAVVTAGDWDLVLESAGPDSRDPVTDRNIQRVCVAAAAVGRIACFASFFTPWAWTVCVPATGISLACLAYQIQETFLNNQEEIGCPCGCVCTPDGDPVGP